MHMNPEEYVRQAWKKGMSEASIRTVLTNMGYKPEEIDGWIKTNPAPASQAISPAAMPASASPAAHLPYSSPSAEAKPIQSAPATTESLIQPQTAAALESAKPRSRWPAVLISALVLLLLGGGGAFAYVKYFAGPTPAEIVYTALQNETQINSLQYSAQISAKVASSTELQKLLPEGNDTLVFNLAGAVDLQNAYQGSLSVSLSQPIALGLDIISMADTAYLRPTGNLKVGNYDFSALANKWIKADIQKTKDEYISASSTFGRGVSAEQKAQIKTAILNSGAFAITKVLPEENVDGPAYHYQYSLDRQKLGDLYAEIQNILEAPNTDAETARMRDELARTTFGPGEIWIGKTDMYLRKITIALQSGSPDGSVSADAVFAQSHINEPLNLIVPTDTITMDQAAAVIMSQLFKTPPVSLGAETQSGLAATGRDARRMADISMIQNALELYYQKCGYYPGGINSGSTCGPFRAVGDWVSMKNSIVQSNVGVKTVPNDPLGNQTYYYQSSPNGDNYVLGARLEVSGSSYLRGSNPPAFPTSRFTCGGQIYCRSF